jgi:hypothetical protein
MKPLKLLIPLMVIVMAMMTISSRGQTTLLWSETAGTAASGQKSFVTTDLVGNIYMASSVNGTYGLDWKVSSWRADSVSRWTYTYNGGGNNDDIPAAIVVDSAFNIYVAGTIKSSGSNDIRVIKLDSAGNLKWGTNYNRTGSAHDVGTGLAVVGNKLWVSGHSQQSTSNYDYTLLKYDTSGTLNWSRHADGPASGDDYTTALAVRSNGDAYITGNAVVVTTGSVRDIMTLRYTTDGTLQWTKYYGGTSGQHDYGNDVEIDASGNILVAGQTFASGTNSDFVLIKYTSGGTQSWAATYGGSAKKHDAANALMVGADGYYYVTGFTQISNGTSNYGTIRYNSSGTVSWAQTYNGPGSGDDEACAIIEDGNDIVITGKSTGSGTGLDVCTISMVKSSGNVNWTMRINESGSTGDWGWSLCRDEMGNVMVGGMAQMTSSSFVNLLFKINQSVKNATAIRDHLQIIANGVLAIVSDTTSKRILYDIANLCVDSFHKAVLSRYLIKCDQQSANTRTLIRNGIASSSGWSSAFHWEKILDRRIYIGHARRPAMIYIPGFETFTRSGFISGTPAVAFSHGETDYPIYDVPDENPLYESDLLSTATMTLVAQPAIWWHKYAPCIRLCYAYIPDDIQYRCNVCGSTPPVGPLPTGSFCTSSCMIHELGIRLGYDFDYDCSNVPPAPEICLDVDDINHQPNINNPIFAHLQAIPGYNFYELLGTGSNQTVRKIPYPIYDVDNNMFGVSMTLCPADGLNWYALDFNDYHGPAAYLEDFAIGWGGVYKISRPGVNMQPVYFSFPFTQFLRYDQGPDINIYYGGDDALNTCANGTKEIEQQYFLACCDFCTTTETTFGLSTSQAREVLATTDYSTISSFWSDNAVTVAFNDNANPVDPGSVATFYASSGPTPCSPASYSPVSMTPICTMDVLSDGRYEIRKDFVGSASYASGTNLLIHVRAQFSNGEAIDGCQTVTISGNTVTNVCVEFRGGINNYSSTSTSYKVDIYLMP